MTLTFSKYITAISEQLLVLLLLRSLLPFHSERSYEHTEPN